MRPALHAEWTKLWTVAGPRWLLLGMIAATVALNALVDLDVEVLLGQAPAAVLGVLIMGGEYRSGLIHPTLTAIPRRTVLLAAKAVTLAGVVAFAGTIAVLGAVRSIVYLILIALLSLGVAAVVRDSATSIGLVLGLLYLLPVVAQAVGDPAWQRRIEQIGPSTGSLAVTAGWAAAGLAAGGLLLRVRDA